MIRGVTDNVLPYDEQDLDAVMRGLSEMARSGVKVQLAFYMSMSLEQRKAAKSMSGYNPNDYDNPGYDHGNGSMPHEFGDQ